MAARAHHYTFAHRYVPAVFASDPSKFMANLARDGMKFIIWMWDRAGQNTPPDDRIAPDGLAETMRKGTQNVEVAIITLPTPEKITEAYFVAAAYHPDINGELFSRYFTLEHTIIDLKAGTPGTMFCGWSGTIHSNMGGGPAPELEAFYQVVQDKLTSDIAGPKS